MVGMAVRFKRATAPLSELVRAQLCESSGSEHLADNSQELEDIGDSFLCIGGEIDEERGSEKAWREIDDDETEKKKKKKKKKKKEEEDGEEMREMLENLLGSVVSGGGKKIRTETEKACRRIGMVADDTEGFKRRLMSHLRDRGLDAGLCKSRWEKTSQFPAGSYEYIDILDSGGNRFIVETSLAGEFQIARPTTEYLALLDAFPSVFVGRPDTLKQVVRLMCAAAKESMKSRDMPLPPWRKIMYMMGKWFGSYKRTTNTISTYEGLDNRRDLAKKQMAGFDLRFGIPALGNCNGEFVSRGLKIGNLAVALKGI